MDDRAVVIEHDAGPWREQRWPRGVEAGLGLLVLDGLLLRRVGLHGRFGCELLASGDVLRPWQQEDSSSAGQTTSGWRVVERCRLAVLDVEFAHRMARYPEVYGSLFARGVRRCRNLTVNMAIVQRPRIQERLYLLLCSFADRWGKVRAEGVFVQSTLTHSVLAELVAARRPTVTAALNELERCGAIARLQGGVLLTGKPPESFVEPVRSAHAPSDRRFSNGARST